MTKLLLETMLVWASASVVVGWFLGRLLRQSRGDADVPEAA